MNKASFDKKVKKQLWFLNKKDRQCIFYTSVAADDLSGVVHSGPNAKYKKGDKVLDTGYDVGVTRTGGFSAIVHVPGEGIVPIPHRITNKES
ncbi:hypothetical protein C7Q58_14630, partial [Staphylococcus aureus]